MPWLLRRKLLHHLGCIESSSMQRQRHVRTRMFPIMEVSSLLIPKAMDRQA
jgi:hypothetical protein